MPFSGQFGITEIAIILVIVLLVFGPKRLPELGRSVGKGMREFKESIAGAGKDHEDSTPEIEHAAPEIEHAAPEGEHAAEKPEDTPLEGEVVHNRKS